MNINGSVPWREVPAMVVIAVLTVLGCIALVNAADGADPYYLAEPQARKAGKWLVVFQGCEPLNGWGDVMTCTGALRGYPSPCAIICRPGPDGYLHRVTVIEYPTAAKVNSAIEAARPRPEPTPAANYGIPEFRNFAPPPRFAAPVQQC